MPTSRSILSLTALLAAGALATGAARAQITLGDLEPGQRGSFPNNFVPIAGGVVFQATTNARGWELWFSDGTAANTRILEALPGPASGILQLVPPARLGDRAVFFATDGQVTGLFLTDGSLAGTRFLAPLVMASGAAAETINTPLTPVGDKIVFAAAANGPGGSGLFVTDGTANGTQRLADLPTPYAGTSASLNGVALFGIPTDVRGAGLWRTDGSAAGTRLVANAGPGRGRLVAPAMLGGGRALVIERFPASAGAVDRVLLYDDATGSLTPVTGMPARDVFEVAGLPTPRGSLGRGVAHLVDPQGNGLVVGIDPVTGAAGTPVPLGEPLGRMISAHGQAWITAGGASARIWKSDGTAAGTAVVWPPLSSPPAVTSRLQPIGANQILFVAGTNGDGYEPWTTDGVRTRQAADVIPGGASSQADDFAAAPELGPNGLVFCRAFDVRRGSEPMAFHLDRTGAATFEVVRAACPAASSAVRLDSPSPPTAGSASYAIELSSNRASAPAALWFGSDLAAPAVPCGPAMQPLVVAGIGTGADGTASVGAPLPRDPSLVGARIYVAGAVARAGGSFLGVADFSAVHALVIGE